MGPRDSGRVAAEAAVLFLDVAHLNNGGRPIILRAAMIDFFDDAITFGKRAISMRNATGSRPGMSTS